MKFNKQKISDYFNRLMIKNYSFPEIRRRKTFV